MRSRHVAQSGWSKILWWCHSHEVTQMFPSPLKTKGEFPLWVILKELRVFANWWFRSLSTFRPWYPRGGGEAYLATSHLTRCKGPCEEESLKSRLYKSQICLGLVGRTLPKAWSEVNISFETIVFASRLFLFPSTEFAAQRTLYSRHLSCDVVGRTISRETDKQTEATGRVLNSLFGMEVANHKCLPS